MFIFRLCECENSNYSCYCMVNYSNIISNEFLEKNCLVSYRDLFACKKFPLKTINVQFIESLGK